MSAAWPGIARCATCRFWRPPPNESTTARYCLHPALYATHEWPFSEECAYGDGDSTHIKTGAKFGCPHHEPTP